ncbi:hypothetical protein JG687_00010453 [Phytophthora cactorum]|uniref:Uncharacterized protein n=1 Tax=Phytophthora cactorum TaxID=29920 RepID=A0A8T1UBX7_9STRA|nr:hypothetical protein JG687_00010453 [Phytophthora cactorum]
MTKSTKKAAKTTSDEESLSARLEEESKEWDESTPLHAAIEFWFQLQHGKPCFDQEDEEDQDEAREDKEQEADEQEDEEGDDEAVDHQPPSDSNATRTTTTDSSKADKRSNASPTPASPRNPK